MNTVNRSSYFRFESTLVLVGLTTPLLILPPLPHPSFVLLLIPIGIVCCLRFLI
ncbi:BnaC08g48330D [Brassica napus]|uniref:BnaC08g48330D protein n=3 Tax=Brassica TaxID=3705 RepID=A0A078JKN8_BRANA|nr:BnaC08g48330D [Brassica napus]VDD56201.1 unnamed protein product [Brassica oleracea]